MLIAPRSDKSPVVSLYFDLFFVFLVDVVDLVDLFCIQAAAGTRHDDFLVPVVIWAEVAVGDNGLLVEVLAMLGSGQGQWHWETESTLPSPLVPVI